MAREILAPGAEVVPDAPCPMTVAQLRALPEDNWIYELVDGKLVRMSGSRSKATRIAARLIIAPGIFIQPRRLGDVSGADGEYDLTLPISRRTSSPRSPRLINTAPSWRPSPAAIWRRAYNWSGSSGRSSNK